MPFNRRLTVSIHAPAWGATLVVKPVIFQRHVSIHAPAWGATMSFPYNSSSDIVSIHAPAWGATPEAWTSRERDSVSIHAPAWGATFGPGAHGRNVDCFNPRPRVGGDPRRELDPSDLDLFQSTPPRGGRPYAALSTTSSTSFNPRPRVGGDLL